jgi:hypothetical protein
MLYFNWKEGKTRKARLIKMIKVFIPTEKRKFGKAGLARGFWQSDNGRIYYDYIDLKTWDLSIADLTGFNLFRDYLDKIKSGYNQECVFYKNGNVGNVYYGRDKIQVLPSRIYKEVLKVDLKVAIKEALKEYKGCTIYHDKGRYYIEIFKTI